MTVAELIAELNKYPADMHVISLNAYDDASSAGISEIETLYWDGECNYYTRFDYKCMKEGSVPSGCNPDDWKIVDTIKIW